MLGAGFMQGVAIRSARSKGWHVTAVDANPAAVCKNEANAFYPVDLKNRDELLRLATQIRDRDGLDGVFTAATDFSASVAWITDHLGLPGHTFEAALNASDKLRMRACFKRDGVPCPRFFGIDRGLSTRAVSLIQQEGLSYPLVVKPVDNMGGRGCMAVRTETDLAGAIESALSNSRSGRVIIEEFMDGKEFSIEALVFDGEVHLTGLADRHIFFPPFFIEMGHTIPADIDSDTEAALVEVFRQGIKSLGLTHGVAKGDLKYTSRGVMVGEIAGRLSGGYMSGWTFPYSSGIDLTSLALDLAIGEKPIVPENTVNQICAERAWISIPGTVASVHGLDAARTMDGVREIFSRAAVGDSVRFPINNVEKAGNCIAVASGRRDAITSAESACRSIVIRLATNCPLTDSFLSATAAETGGFPPDAFNLPPGALDSSMQTLSVEISSQKRTKVLVRIPRDLDIYLDTGTDWAGRTLREALALSISIEDGLVDSLSSEDDVSVRSLWRALARGSVQGILYRYDSQKK